MDTTDKTLLNLAQIDFEITKNPYEKFASTLGIDESDVLNRLKRMKDEKIIRYIGASVDSSNLNFNGILVAVKVPVNRIDEVSKLINTHPGITHNYLRKDEYNMWFTISEPNDFNVEATVKKLMNLCKIEDFLLLKSDLKYKVNFSLKADIKDKENYNFEKIERKKIKKTYELSARDREIIIELKKPFNIVSRPFNELSQRLNINENELIEKLRDYRKSGVIRKVGAIIAQRKVGYNYNALVLWNIEEDKIDLFGEKLASYKNISHCYRRTVYPNWNYPIYSMIHCYDENHFKELLKLLKEDETVIEYKILRTEKELKKKRMNFSDLSYREWHETYL